MSIVSIQLGQCGNQIGEELFNNVIADVRSTAPNVSPAEDASYVETSTDRFFNTKKDGSLEARAVLIDTEEKVIQCLLNRRRPLPWSYNAKSVCSQRRGSGNNWAQGFCVFGDVVGHQVVDALRSQVERCDRLSGLLLMLSLAGGTGSGLGAYVSQLVADEFPKCFQLAPLVWPYDSGEVIVQSYNSLLTLSHLHQHVEALLSFSNDDVERIGQRLAAGKQVNFSEMNSIIGHQLASVLQPAEPIASFSHLLNVLCPQPDYKLLSLYSCPQLSERTLRYTTWTWPGLMKHLRQMLITNCSQEEGMNWSVKPETKRNISVANVAFLRGIGCQSADSHVLNDDLLYPLWSPPQFRFASCSTRRPFNHYPEMASLLSNNQSFISRLNPLLERAWRMFSSKAYLHQYQLYGLCENDFLDSFIILEQALMNYKQLS